MADSQNTHMIKSHYEPIREAGKSFNKSLRTRIMEEKREKLKMEENENGGLIPLVFMKGPWSLRAAVGDGDALKKRAWGAATTKEEVERKDER